MHPFPGKAQTDRLLLGDPVLTQIVVNPYGLSLVLDNQCQVICEEALTYVGADSPAHRYNEPWRNEAPITFHRLLEKRLIAVERGDLDLTLRFESGGALIIHSALGPYESGQIYIGRDMFIF